MAQTNRMTYDGGTLHLGLRKKGQRIVRRMKLGEAVG